MLSITTASTSRRRGAARLTAGLLAVLVTVALAVAGASVFANGGAAGGVTAESGAAASAVAGPGPGPGPGRTYYVAIGASESVGIQPAPGHPRGVRTDHGYANDLVVAERHRWPGLRLVQFGCPGTTMTAAVHGGSTCRYPLGSQLATALAFVRSHAASTVLVTVDLGFNDLHPCLRHQRVDQRCVGMTLHEVGTNLHLLLRQLKAVGGPRLHVIGLEHNDPYLGYYLGGLRGRTFADASVAVFDRLNDVLRAGYRTDGAAVADVPRFFEVGSHRLVRLSGHGRVPTEVALACRLGWTCSPRRFAHHNVHPNTRGYDAIADAAAAALRGRISRT